MSSTRLETLKGLAEANPSDSFVRYGLAMEYRNTGDLESAVREFRGLIERDPNYAAAYFHGGQTLEKLGRNEEAATIYREGLEAAERKGDRHTRDEIQAALDLLG